jgi:hypothetical protein
MIFNLYTRMGKRATLYARGILVSSTWCSVKPDRTHESLFPLALARSIYVRIKAIGTRANFVLHVAFAHFGHCLT